MLFLLLQRSDIVTDTHVYYEKDTPLRMTMQCEEDEGGAFLLDLMGEPPDSGFLVGMRVGAVEQVPIAQ